MTGTTLQLPRLSRPASGRLLGDKRLAQRAAAGDADAFTVIFERYHQPLYRYCLSILRDPDDAKDALQSTMSSALTSLPGEGREIALKAWLFRVAHNHAISMIRARRDHGGDEVLATVADPRAQAQPEDRERLRELLVDLEALPERQRAALTMRELNGLGFDEIGAALEMSGSAARQAVYEARMGLKGAEEGRSMECDRARELISTGDRRSLRGLRVRAHLRACAGCTDYRAAVAQRRTDLQALSPPIAMVASVGVLQGLIGGAGGAATAAGGVAAATGPTVAAVASSAGLKTAALVAAGVIGAGAAGYAGFVDNPLGTGGPQAAPSGQQLPEQPGPGAAGPAPVSTSSSAPTGSPRTDPRERGPAGSSAGGNPPAHANGSGPPAHSSAGGNPPMHANGSGPPAHSSAGGNPPVAAGSPTPAAPAPAAADTPAASAPQSLPPQAQAEPPVAPAGAAAPGRERANPGL